MADAKNSQPVTPLASNSASSLLNSALTELNGMGESWASADVADGSESTPFDADDGAEEIDDLTDGSESDDSEPEETDGDEEESDEEESDEDSDEDDDAPEGSYKVEVTDENGRREIVVDPSDKTAVTRAFQQAAGAKKLYSKYTGLREEVSTLKQDIEKYKEADDNWNKFEGIYESQGIDGIVKLLEGKGVEALLDEREQFRQTYNKWTPEQRAAYDKKKWEDTQAKREAALRKELADTRAAVAAEKDAAELGALEGYAHSAFAQASFAGKLGDKSRELRLDRTMWNDVKSELEYLESKGVALTQQVVNKVVRESREAIGSGIKMAADKQSSKSLASKKAKAKAAVQSKVMKSERSARKEVNKDVDDMSIGGMSQLMVAALNGGRKKK